VSGAPIDEDEETAIYGEPGPPRGRPKKETKRGHDGVGAARRRETPAEQERRQDREREEFRRRAIEMTTPTAIASPGFAGARSTPEGSADSIEPDVPVPVASGKSEPIRVISMKTPAEPAARRIPEGQAPVVKLRAITDFSGHATPAQGYLAPPRDVREVRSRKIKDLVVWGTVVVVIGVVVMIAMILIAR